MTAPAPQTASAAPRAFHMPWGTALLFGASGLLLLAQVITRAPWTAAWLLSPTHVSLPTALTYAFFHADVLHWAANMAFLLIVAPRLERSIGTPAMLGLFLLGAVVAGLLHVSMVSIFATGQESQPLLGASGGIMALLGAYAVRYYNRPLALYWPSWLRSPHRRHENGPRGTTFLIPVGWVLFAWFVSEAVFGWQATVLGRGSVAHWAHVGGFLAGMALAAFTGMHKAGQREDAVSQRTLDLQAQRLAGYLREHPEDIAARVTYAGILLRLGHRDRAAKAFCRAVEAYLATGRRREAADAFLILYDAGLEPSSIALEVKAARVLEDVGQTEHAIAVYDRLASTPGPEAEGAGLRAARLAERLDRTDEARQRYNAFLLMFPESQFAPSVRRALSRLH